MVTCGLGDGHCVSGKTNHQGSVMAIDPMLGPSLKVNEYSYKLYMLILKYLKHTEKSDTYYAPFNFKRFCYIHFRYLLSLAETEVPSHPPYLSYSEHWILTSDVSYLHWNRAYFTRGII